MTDLIDDETLARLIKHQRQKVDSPAHRTMLINVLWTVGQIDTEDLPDVSEGEVNEITSKLPTTYDREDDI